jgi:ketosteroid isomerase-like protein
MKDNQATSSQLRSPRVSRNRRPADGGRAFWEIPRVRANSVEERVALLEQERELREFPQRYFELVDHGDVDALMSLHVDDCVHVGVRGESVGYDAIRREYEYAFSLSRFRLHSITDVVIRLSTANEARLRHRNQSLTVMKNDRLKAGTTIIATRLINVDGAWRITELSSLLKVEYDLISASEVLIY